MDRKIVQIIQEVCAEQGYQCQTFSDGYLILVTAAHQKMFLYGNKYPHNDASAAQICNDKAALSEVLALHQIPHLPHHYCALTGGRPTPEEVAKLRQWLRQYGTMVCKDNYGVGGRNVYRVRTVPQLRKALSALGPQTTAVSVAPYVDIQDEYRVLMLKGTMQLAYRKIRPYVVGDGKATVAELWHRLHRPEIKVAPDVDLQLIPAAGQTVLLTWQHNLNHGAQPELVVDPAQLKQLAALAQHCTMALNLGFVTVDIIQVGGKLQVLEINSGVSLEHFAAATAENYLLAKRAVAQAIAAYFDGTVELCHNNF